MCVQGLEQPYFQAQCFQVSQSVCLRRASVKSDLACGRQVPPVLKRSPAGVYREILCVIGIFFIFFKVQLGQQLAGLGHAVVHGPVLQDALRATNLWQKGSITMKGGSFWASAQAPGVSPREQSWQPSREALACSPL